MSSPPRRGLPLRIYLPIVAVLALGFLWLMLYLLSVGFGVSGSVFGKGASEHALQPQQLATPSVQGGGPPPAVMAQLSTLRARIAAHPHDDVAITQLGDMYLAAGKYEAAIPLYERALRVNPRNVAAQTGLEQAREALPQR